MSASSNGTSNSELSTKQTSNIHRRKSQETRKRPAATDMQHIVFGIVASAKLWNQRKEFFVTYQLLSSSSATYFIYTLKLVSTPRSYNDEPFVASHHRSSSSSSMSTFTNGTSDSKLSMKQTSNIHRRESQETRKSLTVTNMQHIVFSIAASMKLWNQLKEYIKIWYKKE